MHEEQVGRARPECLVRKSGSVIGASGNWASDLHPRGPPCRTRLVARVDASRVASALAWSVGRSTDSLVACGRSRWRRYLARVISSDARSHEPGRNLRAGAHAELVADALEV